MLLSPQGLVGIAKKTPAYQKLMDFLARPPVFYLFPVISHNIE
jgi:hypothetical protein